MKSIYKKGTITEQLDPDTEIIEAAFGGCLRTMPVNGNHNWDDDQEVTEGLDYEVKEEYDIGVCPVKIFVAYPIQKKTMNGKSKEVKCKHNPKLSKMGYVAAHNEAERRLKKGQRQTRCNVCKLWFFKDEY